MSASNRDQDQQKVLEDDPAAPTVPHPPADSPQCLPERLPQLPKRVCQEINKGQISFLNLEWQEYRSAVEVCSAKGRGGTDPTEEEEVQHKCDRQLHNYSDR